MWYVGQVICTVTCSLNVAGGVLTWDKCLDLQAAINYAYTGYQMPSRHNYHPGYYLNFGCYEYDPINTKETKKVDDMRVRLKAWQIYGPQARPPRDLNINRILKREKYDYPRPPWKQVPGKQF